MKILLFDIDGTLVRAGGSGRKALNAAALALYGKDGVCDEFSLAGRTDQWNFRAAAKAALGRTATAAEVERLHQEYLKRLPRFVSLALRKKTYILPRGIKSLLKKLHREEDILLGLGTGNMERGARIKLGPSGFNGYFRFGGFGGDGFRRVDLLKKAVHRAKAHMNGQKSPAEVFVIGDTPHDIAAGKKAGYKTVAVGTGFSTWEELVKSRPDHLARDFRGISQWLKWFGIRSSTRRKRANS